MTGTAPRAAARAPARAGVVGVPVSAFTQPGSPTHDALRTWVRFTFVKRQDVLEDAVARLRRAFG